MVRDPETAPFSLLVHTFSFAPSRLSQMAVSKMRTASALEATALKERFQSFRISFKTKLVYPLLPSRPTKPYSNDVDITSTTDSLKHEKLADTQAPISNLAPSATYASDATTIRPASDDFFDIEKANMRYSGVSLPPEYSAIQRNNTDGTLVISEKPYHPSIPPRVEEITSRAQDDTKPSTMVAVRSLVPTKDPIRPQVQPVLGVIPLFLHSAMESTKSALLALDRGSCEGSYFTKGTLYYSGVLASLRILLRHFGASKRSGYYGMSFDAGMLLSEKPFSKCTILPGFLNPIDFLFAKIPPWRPLPDCDEASLLVTTTPVHEHAPNQGKAPSSNGQKRPRANQSSTGEDSKRQRLGNGMHRGQSNAGNRDDRGDNDDNDPGSEPYASESVRDESTFTFACPFYKHDPITYRECLFRHTSTKTNYVKQHLRRHHLPPIHCPICKTVFEAESVRDEHIRLETCENRDFRFPGLDKAQKEALERIPRNESPRERWYRMWAIIFPDEPRPASPYVMDPWIEVGQTAMSMWMEGSRPKALLENHGLVLSRPGANAGSQSSSSSFAEAWSLLEADFRSYTESRVHSRPDAVNPTTTTTQQLERQSVPSSFHDQDASQHIAGPPSQGQAGTGSIPVPARGHAAAKKPRPGMTATDSGIGISPTQSISEHGNISRMDGGASRRSQPTHASMQQSSSAHPMSRPQLSNFHQSWSNPLRMDSPGASFYSDEMFMPGAYDATSAVEPRHLLAPSPGHAPSMARDLSHTSLPEPLRRTGGGIGLSGLQAGVVGMGNGFQPQGFSAGLQAQGRQGSSQGFQRASQVQGGVASNFGQGGVHGGLPATPAFTGVPGHRFMQDGSTYGMGQSPGGFVNDTGNSGMPIANPQVSPAEWVPMQSQVQGSMAGGLQLGGHNPTGGVGSFEEMGLPDYAQATQDAWGAGVGQEGNGLGDGHPQVEDDAWDFLQFGDPEP